MSDGAKVLIADDEQACIDLVREALADMPCEVVSAMDGEEALKVTREQKPDLVILDVQMPKRSGWDVYVELRSDDGLKSVPVIMLTAVSARTGIKFSGKDMGDYLGSEPEAYIDKPIEPIVLKQVVSKLLKGRSTST